MVLRDNFLFENWTRLKLEKLTNLCNKRIFDEGDFLFRQVRTYVHTYVRSNVLRIVDVMFFILFFISLFLYLFVYSPFPARYSFSLISHFSFLIPHFSFLIPHVSLSRYRGINRIVYTYFSLVN